MKPITIKESNINMKIHATAILLATLFAAQTASAGNIKWRLPGDIQRPSNQISFNQGANDVWFFMKSAGTNQKEYSYSLLSEYSTPCSQLGIEGLLCWYPSLPNGFPWVGFNATATTQTPVTLTWPAQTLAVHPDDDKLAIVGWRSPVNGKISVNGSFTDFDGTCGDGALWFINQGETTLKSGSVNQGSETFNLNNISIRSGEVLYFIVDSGGNKDCDTTGLDLTISRGQSKGWEK